MALLYVSSYIHLPGSSADDTVATGAMLVHIWRRDDDFAVARVGPSRSDVTEHR